MSTYRVAEGHGVALVSLTVITPQPMALPVAPTRRDYVGDGIHDQGLFVEFTWSSLKNITAYQTLLALFGLDSAKFADVTIYAKNDLMTFARYNGLAVRPEPGREVGYRSFPRNITILIRDLVAL